MRRIPVRTSIERNSVMGTISEIFGYEKAFNSKNFRTERMADDAAISLPLCRHCRPFFGVDISLGRAVT